MMPHAPAVDVLAAWLETDSHLVQPPVAILPQQTRVLCQLLQQNGWDPANGPVPASLRAQLENAAAQAVEENNLLEGRARQPQLTVAEISQRSVDLLLREYYQMVQAQQQRSAMHTSDGSGGGVLQRLFLLLCPALPACCDLRHLVAAVTCTTRVAATLVVMLACVIIPGWLVAIRELLQQQQLVPAAAVAAMGLTVMLVSEIVHRSASAQRRAAAAAVTPATVRRYLAPDASAELATLRKASKTVTTSNHNKQSLGHQHLQLLQQQQQQQAPAASPAAGGSSSGSSGLSYMSLLPALAALQGALGVSSSEPPTSRERMAEEVARLCSVLGVPHTPDMTSSAANMAATIAQLKGHVGI